MAVFVIPLHAIQVLSDANISDPINPPVCIAGIFVHLVSTCTRSWAIAAFLLLNHLHNGNYTIKVFTYFPFIIFSFRRIQGSILLCQSFFLQKYLCRWGQTKGRSS